ncbi:MAG: hypothetical protein OXF11_03345 [Deltaproteobacteria bacterium]|nr:hypothetical protein [Deltaproteobacteria bacterium]
MAADFHIVSLTLHIGLVVGLWRVLLPALRHEAGTEARTAFLVRVLRVYNPTQIALLGILTLTGASRITDLKALHGTAYSEEFGSALAVKLLLAFFVIMLGTWQCMGIAHRFVRQTESPEGVSAEGVDRVLRKLDHSSVLMLVFLAATLWVGLSR